MSVEFARSLIDAGCPVVVCRPNPNWSPGSAVAELFAPKGWALITAAECDLSGYREGVDTLALVGGHGVDVVDVDTKDGGSIDNLPPFEYFGETRTPSGGIHRYVVSTGIAKMSPLRTSAGHVGDYVGGTVEGGSRLLAYLPGSVRPKYPDGAYTLTQPLELAALGESEPDEALIAALLGCGGRRDGRPGKPAETLSAVTEFLTAHSEIVAPCTYGRAAVTGLLEDADAVVPGDPKRGRHGWAVRAASRAVELVRAGCATSADLDALEDRLRQMKPDEDWFEALAWALSNADGAVKCAAHGATADYVASLEAPAAPPESPPAVPAAAPSVLEGNAAEITDNATEAVLDAAAVFAREVDQEAYRLSVREAAQRKVKSQRAGVAARPPVMPLAEFLAVPDAGVEYRIDRLWPTGGRVILAAQYKAGKSTLIGNVVRSIADGVDFLDTFTVAPGSILLIDNELDERTLRRWLRDQGIVNTDAVRLVALRGKTSTFDILDPQTRDEWARALSGADVVIFDCLRPVLDALGLSEDKDAGRFLVAFDALLDQAGASEAVVVHHMGHSGERSRGDSRILDWPDATWKLVREDTDDPASPRYFAAFGRDVDQSESKLAYEAATRRLSLAGGNRKEAAADEVIEPLLDLLAANPEGLSGRQIRTALEDDHADHKIRDAIKRAEKLGMTTQSAGARRSTIHKLSPSVSVGFSVSPVGNPTESECVSVSIGHTHTPLHTDTERDC